MSYFVGVVQDANTGGLIAVHNADKLFFSASLYKLYYAVLAWQDLGSGDLTDETNFQADRSLTQCLDLMIRESDSPCGEALLARYDYAQATERLREIGLPNVNTAAFKVSAIDMAVLLQASYEMDIMSTTARQALFESMRQQVYADGLKQGFSDFTVRDKVGFSDTDWHDVGLVELTDSQTVTVVILSENAGAEGVAELSSKLSQYFKSVI